MTVIRVENLGKKYRIHHQQRERYTALRDVIANRAKSLFRNFQSSSPLLAPCSPHPAEEDFWALKDVSFDIKQGEVVGIIGRNGAGKSTLLKVLSRITEPTTGRIAIKGRIASLLEVGTGFHPELTGRENIYLNGAILGMSRVEIARKFDEIVDFAEVEKFLDTPVKRYSSGMYVRLAFAVAAHMEPEVLVIDEVLAVGDAEFQKKCLGKMSEVAGMGRTVLFVSHNMATVNRLCQRGILLEKGQIIADGDTNEVTSKYLISESGSMAERYWYEPELRPGDDVVRLIGVKVLQHQEVTDNIDIRFPVQIEMTYQNYQEGAQLISVQSFFDGAGVHLFVSADFEESIWSTPRPAGIYQSTCEVPGNLFAEGVIRVVSEVSTRHPVYQIHFLVFDCVAFQVVDTGAPGNVRSNWGRPIPGVMRPHCQWSTLSLDAKDSLGQMVVELVAHSS